MLFGFDELNEAVEAGAAELPDDLPAQATSHPRRPSTWWSATAGLVAGLVLGLALWLFWPESNEQLTQQDVDEAIDAAAATAADEPAVAAAVFNQIAPSLVVVRATSAGTPDTTAAEQTDETAANIGGGVIINEQGQILTANHVLAEADAIELIFADGSTSSAEIVTADPASDIAVLEAVGSTGPLVPAVLGNSRTLRIGDPIFAVGNPLGLTGSMSAGVISGLHRDIPFPGEDDIVFENLIQFDAAVNQGNSGGPLVNEQGQVVGIVTALADPSSAGFFIGIGFAVPIDIAAGGAANGPSQ